MAKVSSIKRWKKEQSLLCYFMVWLVRRLLSLVWPAPPESSPVVSFAFEICSLCPAFGQNRGTIARLARRRLRVPASFWRSHSLVLGQVFWMLFFFFLIYFNEKMNSTKRAILRNRWMINHSFVKSHSKLSSFHGSSKRSQFTALVGVQKQRSE